MLQDSGVLIRLNLSTDFAVVYKLTGIAAYPRISVISIDYKRKCTQQKKIRKISTGETKVKRDEETALEKEGYTNNKDGKSSYKYCSETADQGVGTKCRKDGP